MDPAAFERDLRDLINRHSMENGSDTPDYMLANYLARCLEAYNATVRAREEWYGRAPKPAPEEGDCRTCGWDDTGNHYCGNNCAPVRGWWRREDVEIRSEGLAIRLPGAPPCPGWKRRDNNTEKENERDR